MIPPMQGLGDAVTTTALLRLEADIVGFGALDGLPETIRAGFPIGISDTVAYQKEIIHGITRLPTREYHEWYDILNARLDMIVAQDEKLLHEMGYRAAEQTHGNEVCSHIQRQKTKES